MDIIIRMIAVLCLCSYVMGLLIQFVPVNQTEKSIKLVVTLYLIASVFSPMEYKTDYIFEKDMLSMSDIYNNSEEYVTFAIKEETERTLSRLLDEKNICYTDVDVHINKQTDKLCISQVVIYGADSDNMAAARDALTDIVTGEKIISGDNNE